MSGSEQPWSVPVAGVLVLLAASIGGIVSASDPDTRQFGLPSAGLLALIGLGLLARRRWALWAGFTLIPISAALTAAAFKNTDAEAGRMMAWVTVLLLLLLLPALPAVWRHPNRRAAPVKASATPTQPAALARRPSLGQRLLLGLFAVPTIIVGMALFLVILLGLASGSTSPGTILVLAAILLFLGSGTVMFRPRRRALTFDLTRLSIDGASSQAFLARYDRLGRAAIPAALTGAAIIGTCALINAHQPAVIWLPAAILTALATIGLLVLLTTGWRSYVALVPSGLYVPGPRQPTLIPWTAVEDGYLNWVPHSGGAEPFVAVSVSDPARDQDLASRSAAAPGQPRLRRRPPIPSPAAGDRARVPRLRHPRLPLQPRPPASHRYSRRTGPAPRGVGRTRPPVEAGQSTHGFSHQLASAAVPM